MSAAAKPANEDDRLKSLHDLHVLDTAPEAEFDALVHAASLVCGAPISLISLIDRDRQWFKANVGLEGTTETARSQAFCAHAIHDDDILEVPDATVDPVFRDNPLVTGAPDIRFYAGAPLILGNGQRIGTLCVIDRAPRQLDPTQRRVLQQLARAAVKALESRHVALRLHESEARQRALNAKLATEGERRSHFLATLAHELRNPLSALLSGSKVLGLSKGNWSAVERIRAMIERQVRHMSRLVDDLNEASSIDAGKTTLSLQPAELRAVLSAALEASLSAIEARHHALHLKVPEDAIRIIVDPIRLSQVVANLLVNAAKYTPEGGNITLRVEVNGGSLAIDVEDDGIGIAADALPEIFGMFMQVETDDRSAKSGLGIGLALVDRLVSLHGGTVAALSEGLGKGSIFRVRLPGVVPDGASRK